MRYTLVAISLILALSSYAQSRVFNAQFKSIADGHEILYARVTNGTGITKLTNINGKISIPYQQGAEIIISHLTYDSLIIKTEEFEGQDSLLFYMTPRTYELREVKFSVLGDRVFFDNKFVKNDLGVSDEDKVRDKLRIIEMKQELIGLDRAAQSGVVLGSPISYLYDRYSKDGKDRARYELLMQQDRERRAFDTKLDDYMITSLSGYEGEDLETFKEFCSFHPSYILQAETLEIFMEVVRCREEFKKQEGQ